MQRPLFSRLSLFTWMACILAILLGACESRDGLSEEERNYIAIANNGEFNECYTFNGGSITRLKALTPRHLTEVLIATNQKIYGRKAATDEIREGIYQYIAAPILNKQSPTNRNFVGAELASGIVIDNWKDKYRILSDDFIISYHFKICLQDYIGFDIQDSLRLALEGKQPNEWNSASEVYSGHFLIDIELSEKGLFAERKEKEFYREVIPDTISHRIVNEPLESTP